METDIYQKVGKRYQPRPDLQQFMGFDPHTLIIGATHERRNLSRKQNRRLR